ncbi:MAG: DUF4026 domain-containing protein [Chloroflexota bacterium]
MPFFSLFKPKTVLPLPRLRLAVFSTEETLPWPLQLVHPARLWGAMAGAPTAMRRHPDPRLQLEQPMTSGDYLFEGLAGSVIACVQERRQGEPYPGQDAVGGAGRLAGMGPAECDRLERARWVIALQLTEVLADAREAVLYQVELADRLASLSEGIVLDQEAHRYYLPGRWRVSNGSKPVDVREHVTLHLERVGGGRMWVHTHGLGKFGRHELELLDLPESLAEAACRLLIDLAQQAVAGAPLRPGERVGDPQASLLLRPGRDKSCTHYGGASLELVDSGREAEAAEGGAARGVAAYNRIWSERRAV